MRLNGKFANQQGMTLVEVLAAITILAIVFIGFLSIFPQMIKSNMQTEEKLETMNLAKKELAELKDGIYELSDYDELGTDGTIKTFTKEQYSYRYVIDYYIDEDLEEIKDVPESVKLNKIHIKVNKDGKVISETFGYLKNSDY